ncbi:hypothetical protein ABDD95_16615 [Mucilaginibacter sp. PAMB04274]|uniref:hypothetical protein n=1 Tax=Mucilaginibacter sp. PAMB04274 TaxID=3138568 RepID=UPI0031F6B85C
MNMQDNELDDLFRTKLGNLEVEPSARVWGNISAELGTPQKRSLAPVWSIAASILVVLGIGSLFLLNKPAKVAQNQVAVNRNKPLVKTIEREVKLKMRLPEALQTSTYEQPAIQNVMQVTGVKHRISSGNQLSNKRIEPANEPANDQPTVQPVPVLAAVPAQTIPNAVVPEMALSNKLDENDAAALKPITQPAVEPAMAHQPEKRRKRGISTLGGLINAVVAKVDKREDKLIEFTETDDDQANVTGLNLGIIKIKKEK